ncbi:type IV pilus biogenesis/stability protein PilW [Montanilutibacter psychrotolerans]|uniref:Type IV pilus biogenesis/stability protein PilW n=1 Tax=Montanilutibacter psychrotolerans TaxID=1327343 RepID=A0A3M8SXF0_9GAMM|nr:type IV pilus biogenesis/stability protein PilW [Lysobacter psychrotolerans]RNF85365.1 type IV pilus biogenesis/stability protein PilW [Lysobacter psychrotolerans]
MRRPERPLPGRALTATVLAVVVLCSASCSRPEFLRPSIDSQLSDIYESRVPINGSRRGNSGTLDVQLYNGRQKLAAGDPAGARDLAAKALQINEKSAPAHTLMAVSLDQLGNSAVAGQHYLRAAELDPTRGAMLNNYGTWLCGNGRAAESLDWFDQALQDSSYSTPASALANAGHCATQAGLAERGGRYLRDALSLDPDSPVALAALAESEFRAGRAFEARAFSQRRLAAAPADAQSLLLASQIEEKLGDKDAAASYVQRLRAEFPGAAGSETGDGSKR